MNAQIQVELQSWMGGDSDIAMSAWTSTYDKSKIEDKYNDSEKVEKLVRRLITEGHSTPVESVVLRFWIRMPIFVDRQHMTHRIQSSSGLSGRYRTLPGDFFSLPDDIKDIAAKINYGGGERLAREFDRACNEQLELYEIWLNFFKTAEQALIITNAEYKRAREVIRGVLGTSFMVERTTIMNLRSFANYQRLRNSDHAQPEIRKVAQLMLAEVRKAGVAPIALETLKEIGWRI